MASKLAAAAKSLLGLTPAKFREAKKNLDRFERFCGRVTTKQGEQLKLEGWQRLVLLAYFAGFAEILILIPKGAGKTTLLAALGVYHLLTTKYPQVYIGASTKRQADVMYAEARRISQLHPAWRKRLIPRPSTKFIYVGKGAEGGFLQVLASDRLRDESGSDEGRGVLEGIEPTLGLVDELHAHVNDAIYAAIQGALHKRNGQMLTISTAGTDEGSLLKRMRDAALKFRDKLTKKRFTVARHGRFVMFEWALRPEDDREDMAVVKLANPSSFVTQESLKALRDSPSMTSSRWARRHCNLWGHSEGGWIASEEYDAGEQEIELPTDEPIILGYDHARSYDHAGLVALRVTDAAGAYADVEDYDPEVHNGARGQIIVLKHLRPSEEDGGTVPYWKVKRAIREACERYTVAAVGYDKLGGFKQAGEELADEGLLMVPVSMKGDVWAPLTAELHAAIKSGRLRHTDDPDLRDHVLGGEVKDTQWGERLHGKPKSGKKVDLLIATGIAWYVAFFTDALAQSEESVYNNPDHDLLVLS